MRLDGAAVVTETNYNGEIKEFSIKNSPIAFEILSSRLYQDSIMAIVREIISNAWESHCNRYGSDASSHPIDIELPTAINPYWTVRDHGTGLSDSSIHDLYTVFFSSTKSSSNDYTGCFGLGSKTPFSYSKMFKVTSVNGGLKCKYLCVVKNGYPSVLTLSKEETTEDSGLEISIPIKQEDDAKFISSTYTYLNEIPEITVNILGDDFNRSYPCMSIDKEYRIDIWEEFGERKASDTTIRIKQGLNVYPLSYSSLNDFDFLSEISKIEERKDSTYTKYLLQLEVPIGTLDVTPSREHLSDTTNNIEKINEILSEVEVILTNVIREKYTYNIENPSESTEDKEVVFYLYKALLKSKLGKLDTTHRNINIFVGKDSNSNEDYGIWLKLPVKDLDIQNKNNHWNYNRVSITRGKNIFLIISKSKPRKDVINSMYAALERDNVKNPKLIFLNDGQGFYGSSRLNKKIPDFRFFVKFYKIIGSLPELGYSISIMSLPAFKKKFSVKKIRKSKKIVSINPDSVIVYISDVINLNNYISGYEEHSQTEIKNLISFNREDTIFIPNNFKYNCDTTFLIWFLCRNMFPDKEKIRFITASEKYSDFFSQFYNVMTVDNIINRWKDMNLRYLLLEESNLIFYMRDIDNTIDRLYRKRIGDIIRGTLLYKVRNLLLSIFDRRRLILEHWNSNPLLYTLRKEILKEDFDKYFIQYKNSVLIKRLFEVIEYFRKNANRVHNKTDTFLSLGEEEKWILYKMFTDK